VGLSLFTIKAIEVKMFWGYYSGYCAFTHKAGIHAKAILNNPNTYEILKPEDFGLTRYVSIGYILEAIFHFFALTADFWGWDRHRLTGWNAVKSRVEQLKLTLTDDEASVFVGFTTKLIQICIQRPPDQRRNGQN
jgi:homocitrate synthase